jgi:hypothetical protein
MTLDGFVCVGLPFSGLFVHYVEVSGLFFLKTVLIPFFFLIERQNRIAPAIKNDKY